MGLEESFKHLLVLPTGFLDLPVLDPNGWYPYPLLLDAIDKTNPITV